MMFDAHVMVDWSAASVPRTGRDSIWVCWHGADGESLENPSTRHAAKALLAGRLAAAAARGERVLVGFDFPFGYPTGFAAPARPFRPALASGLGRDRVARRGRRQQPQ